MNIFANINRAYILKNTFSIILILFTSLVAEAQLKTTYLNRNFKEVKKKKAIYVMKETEINDTIYKWVTIRGTDNEISKFKYHKNFTGYKYQRENYSSGLPRSEGNLYKEKKIGVWNFYSDWGKIAVSKTYENNIENGIRKRYYIEGGLMNECEVTNERIDGYYKEYSREGWLYLEGKMRNSLKEGIFNYYNESGDIISRRAYAEGKSEGHDSIFINKKIYRVVTYKDDKMNGPFYCYKDNKIIHSGLYLNDTIQKPSETLDSTQLKEYGYLNKMPEYPGGEKELSKFIINNFKYPESAIMNFIEGKVRLKFTVSKEGLIKDICILTDPLGYGCEKEAYRVITLMPRWKPGYYYGKHQDVYFNQPIAFKLF